jgi:hypothetical protein
MKKESLIFGGIVANALASLILALAIYNQSMRVRSEMSSLRSQLRLAGEIEQQCGVIHFRLTVSCDVRLDGLSILERLRKDSELAGFPPPLKQLL